MGHNRSRMRFWGSLILTLLFVPLPPLSFRKGGQNYKKSLENGFLLFIAEYFPM
jgi:hypothetical protein